MLKTILPLIALAAAGSANATVLFSENFDSITGNTLNIGPTAGSMLVFGKVDAVVPDNPFGITGLTSTVIDLDGSPGPGGVRKGGFNLISGRTYALEFVIGGAQRRSVSDELFVTLTTLFDDELTLLESAGLFLGAPGLLPGQYSIFASIAGDSPFVTSTLTFRANTNADFSFGVGTSSSDSIGPLLDSVTLSQVGGVIPEPATWAMMIAGFGLVGFAARRRAAVTA